MKSSFSFVRGAPVFFHHSRIHRLLSVLGLAIAVLLPGATIPHADAAAPATAPNIIFILADDLGAGDVKCFNPAGKIATPHLDALAAQGMIFTEAHSSSAVCTPTRYNILTGRYNWRSTLKKGVLGGFSPPLIEPGRLTVAEYLRRHGYATAAIGKWHLGLDWARKVPEAATKTTRATAEPGEAGDNAGADIDFTRPFGRGPTTLGFDEFFGISASLDMPPYAYLENDRVTVLPDHNAAHPWIGIGHATKKTRSGPTAPGFETEAVLPALAQRTIETIARRAADAKAGKPFFIYLPLNSPHTPLSPTKEWKGKSGLNDYADFVMQTDAVVGQVLAALEKNGLADNTLVIFTSDNGCSPEADYPFLAEHAHDPSAERRGHKADIFDGGHRVPLIVRWPRRVAAATHSEAFVCLGDFMATCADLLGDKLPDNAGEDSISFLPLLQGKAGAVSRDTLVLHSINGSFGIRQGQWKLELCPDSGGWSFPRPGRDQTDGRPRFQLFDLAKDPAEKTNVIADHPDVVKRLGKILRGYVVEGRSTPGAPQLNTPVKAWPQAGWIEEFAK
jgi:arylsulfatase A